MATVNVGKNVPDSAFQSQTTITSVSFGSNCTSVGKNAFKDCISLGAINDNNKIKTIGAGAFAGTAIYAANFSYLNTINKILSSNYYGAFQSCSQLTYVNIPNCNTIAQGTFFDCSNLISINAQNCTQIYAGAFGNCYNLTNINLQKCNYIAGNAFLNCSSLKSFNFENCTIIGNCAFSSCIMLEEADLTKCVGKIVESTLGDTVTLGIGSSAFQNCTNLKKIYLSNSNGIGNGAFTGCINLTKVYIKADKSKPNYIIPLGGYAFPLNSGNIRFYLYADIIEEYKKAPVWSVYKKYMIQFADKNQILYITNDNKEIDINIYSDSDSDSDSDIMFSNIYYNNDEKTFGLITFSDKSDVSVIPNITELNQKFFYGKETLTSIDLPLNCETIGESEFEGCTSLITYTPPSSNSLKEIKNYAFKNCTSLTSFEIPNSIEKLGEGIFAGCSNIEKFKGNFVTYGGKAIVKYRTVEKQTSDGTVEEQKLRTLISVVAKDNSDTNGRIYNISEIDPNIERLGEYCFSGCKELKRVDIPNTVKQIGNYAFEGCENLCEIHFCGKEKITFGENIFDNNSNLKIFILQENFQTFIEENTDFAHEYKDCIYPKPSDDRIIYYTNNDNNIEINDSDTTKETFTTYGDDMNYTLEYTYFITTVKEFTNNKVIQKVIIGENNKKINESAFKNCTSLEYVYIPNTIKEFGNECFYGCGELTSIIIPNKPNKSIYIKQPKEYTRSIDINKINEFLSKGDTKFGNDIFYGCKNLTKFDSYYKDFLSSDNRCYIDGNYLMFFAEGGISNYTFPSDIKVNTINKSAFKGVSIENITICDSVSTIGESAFEGCKIKSIKSLVNGLNNVTTIKEGLDNVITIQKNAFKDCTNLDKISLSNVLTIGDSAFEGCAIKSIEGLDNVTTIQKNAFKDCTSLVEISLKNVSTISESAFEGCTNMIVTNNDLSKVTEIGSGAFKGCKKFGYVEVDDKGRFKEDEVVNLKNITSINDETFNGCEKLNNIYLSEDITKIGNFAFAGCSALCGVYIVDDSVNSKLKSIGHYAFYMNSNLSKFYLNRLSNLTHIGNYAFAGCEKYINIILPNSVESIGTHCFEKSGIQKLTLNENSNLKIISQNAFTNCSNLTSVDIKSTTITTIGKESFYGCENLLTLTLSDTIKYINTSAFAGCKTIKSVYLPLNLIELGDLCFDTKGEIKIYIKKQSDLNDDLSNLRICKFTNYGNRPFGTISSTTTVSIYVPYHISSNINGIRDKYISNIYWGTYKNSINGY